MSTLLQAYADYEAARERLLQAQREHGQGGDLPLMIYDISHLLPPDVSKEIPTIAAVVLQAYPAVRAAQLLDHCRQAADVEARHVLYYLLRHYTSLSASALSYALNRHHTTITYGATRASQLESIDAKFAARLKTIRASCAQALGI